MQFKVGEAIVLCNLDAEVVAKGLIIGVGDKDVSTMGCQSRSHGSESN